MKHWKEAVAVLIGTLSLLGLSFVGAGLLVKIATALCGVGFSWTVAAVVWLALLLAALWLLLRLDAGSRGDDPSAALRQLPLRRGAKRERR